MTTYLKNQSGGLAESQHAGFDIELHEVPGTEPVPPLTTPPTEPPAQDPGDPVPPEIPVREPPDGQPPIRMSECIGTVMAM